MAESDWTINALKEHYDQRFADVLAMVNKNDQVNNARFNSATTERAQIAEQVVGCVTRADFFKSIERTDGRIDSLSSRMNTADGVAKGKAATWAVLVTVVTLITAIATVAIIR